ncbi:haloacid dehalogenase [Mycobacterium sp. MYCO198283]|uniref:HAD family hydrolase n=1 Tax=Mycobacterium sp. MYCO198283 TaxID=2883505 RepID=UPI001E61F53F|nr:HAD family hydrolase [Mycobacterium sp. MYCO198283]MCG5431834.1 haloacid dehalogenase [Mycobacterium sp. MYCO198283]
MLTSTTWRAGRFGGVVPDRYDAPTLRALVFDLDAVADIECDGHRLVFNAAFAAHGLDVAWDVRRYRQLLALPDERQRVAAELRARGIASECDVLTDMLADEIHLTKTLMFEEMIVGADIAARPGVTTLIADAAAAGVSVGVVSTGTRSWVEPVLHRLLDGRGVDALVTADDATAGGAPAYRLATQRLRAGETQALTVAASMSGVRGAQSAGLATMLVAAPCDAPRGFPPSAIRADYGGSDPLTLDECREQLALWWQTHRAPAA